jgi:hypothetical protein
MSAARGSVAAPSLKLGHSMPASCLLACASTSIRLHVATPAEGGERHHVAPFRAEPSDVNGSALHPVHPKGDRSVSQVARGDAVLHADVRAGLGLASSRAIRSAHAHSANLEKPKESEWRHRDLARHVRSHTFARRSATALGRATPERD